MTNFRVIYIDDSEKKSIGVILSVDGDQAVIPREKERVSVNDEEFVVEYINHSFLKGSPTHVIEVHVVNRFEFCMKD